MTQRVALVSRARSMEPMGFGSAERQTIAQIRELAEDMHVVVRVAGGRAARRYARHSRARWTPAPRGWCPPWVFAGADLIHMLALDAPPPRRVPYVVTVHDLAGFHYEDEEPLPGWASDAFRRARRILTPSQFSAHEVLRHFEVDPSKIVVIGTGLGLKVSASSPQLSDAQRAELGLTGSYILRVGGYTRRKNVSLLLDAWPGIRAATGISLVLAGAPTPARQEALQAAPDLDGVIVLDYLPTEVIALLVRSAALLVSTSTYEGVGLPPLEAMSASVPVVAVACDAAKETLGDAAALTRNDPTEFACRVCEVLSDEHLRRSLIAGGATQVAGIGWQQVARRVLDAYAAATDE